jgi:hypothetical protein
MTPSGIPKADFAIAFNPILTQTRTSLRTWAKKDYKIFFKVLIKICSIYSLKEISSIGRVMDLKGFKSFPQILIDLDDFIIEIMFCSL